MEHDPPEKKRFIESSSFYTNRENKDPFLGLKIDDSHFLNEVPTRSRCPKCNRSRRYYCYTCYVPSPEIEKKLPVVNLPLKVDIIKHPKELDGKSTSAHAAILAPNDVKIYTYPDFPSYENEQVLLIFPGKTAISFQEWFNLKHKNLQKNESENMSSNCSTSNPLTEKESTVPPLTRVIFIDSTWRQSKAMYKDERIKSLPCVVLSSHQSVFWRHQRGLPDTYLATIEAVYHLLRELNSLLQPRRLYEGQYDNLLFFFRFFHDKLAALYHPPFAERG